MALVFVATPGASNANSYATVAEADSYFESRLALPVSWDDAAPSKEALLVMATRVLDAAFRGGRVLVQASGGQDAYYLVRRTWAGLPATTTQRLAWPRTGLFHDNGAAVAINEIPWELKEAVSELAGQLVVGDRTLDSDVSVQGITSVRAGSVAVTFRDGYIDYRALPQAVIDLIPPSWYVEELHEPVGGEIEFEVMP